MFLLVYVTTRVEAAGLFAYPFAFALVFIANLTPPSERADPVLRSLYLPIHLFLAVFGYGALFAAFTMAVLYLFQERELLSRSPGRFYYLIPSLERSDTFGGRSVLGGFGFLTLAIVTASSGTTACTGATGRGTRRSGRPWWRGSSPWGSSSRGGAGAGRTPRGLVRHRRLRGRAARPPPGCRPCRN